MGFVGNYAPCGLSPQIDGMPVIPKNVHALLEERCMHIFSGKISNRVDGLAIFFHGKVKVAAFDAVVFTGFGNVA